MMFVATINIYTNKSKNKFSHSEAIKIRSDTVFDAAQIGTKYCEKLNSKNENFYEFGNITAYATLKLL